MGTVKQNIDDNLTRSDCKHLVMQQRREVLKQFPILVDTIKPKRIIEIGTGWGGLSLFLNDLVKQYSEIYSFDILDYGSTPILKKEGINYFLENIFNPVVKNWNKFELNNNRKELFNISPKIIMCDGGHKIGEFNCLADYLSVGDVIMCHDYSIDAVTFETLKVWNWLEIQYSNIKEACEENNLKPFMQQEFLDVAWGCFIKI